LVIKGGAYSARGKRISKRLLTTKAGARPKLCHKKTGFFLVTLWKSIQRYLVKRRDSQKIGEKRP
jgi:hypothetical protein